MVQRTSARRNTGTGKLLRAALRYLRKQDGRAAKRASGGDMTPDRLRHMVEGESRKGYHYRPGGEDFPDRRIGTVLRRDQNTGAYEAKVEFRNANPPPDWQPKQGNQGKSTFWPDSWTPAQVDNAVTSAFTHPNVSKGADGIWRSEHNGVKVMGFYDTATGALKHGFPYL